VVIGLDLRGPHRSLGMAGASFDGSPDSSGQSAVATPGPPPSPIDRSVDDRATATTPRDATWAC